MAHQLLTTFHHDPLLDLVPWVGQRQATFRFELFNGVTGEELGEIHPLRNATLTHDTTRTIKRQLNINLGTVDTALLDPITGRIRLFMEFPNGASYPMGVYMFTDASRQKYTSGQLGSMALSDEMFLVDQQITEGITGLGLGTTDVIQKVLDGLPITYFVVPSPYVAAESWTVGASRGQILEQLSISGDYFSPWFDNHGVLQFIRTFDPATRMPDFDFDDHKKVVREPIILTNDLISAPNRFVVISNAAANPSQEVVGVYDVPPTAPHSLARRGFLLPSVQTIPLTDASQAQAVAVGLGMRQTIFERVSLVTAPDPRHDSYNVVHWDDSHWLEIAWSMALVEGGSMSHLLRRAYLP
jgi:hypothetical protein